MYVIYYSLVDSSSFEHLNVIIAAGIDNVMVVVSLILLPLANIIYFHAVMTVLAFILLIPTFCCYYWLHHMKNGILCITAA